MVLGHNCGIYVGSTLHDTYNGLKEVQHRGREVAGIGAVRYDGLIDVLKWVGKVTDFSLKNMHHIFPADKYWKFLGHVRFATKGRKEFILQDGHPQVQGGIADYRGDHVIIRNAERMIVHNGQVNSPHLTSINQSILEDQVDSAAILEFFRRHGEIGLLEEIPGTYVAAIADVRYKDVVVVRDGNGIMPGVLGLKDGKVGIASENVAFKGASTELIGDIPPGSVTYLNKKGGYHQEQIVSPKPRTCFFQPNYIGDLDSIIDGISSRATRTALGLALAKEHPIKADYVTFVPHCPEVAARAYSQETGIPFIYSLYKKKTERAFQGSTADARKKSIEGNLFPIDSAAKKLKGKRVIVIEDSVVRGNNGTYVAHLFNKIINVEKAYLLSYTPKIGIEKRGVRHGCLDGVDMGPNDNFVARNRTAKEINKFMKIDTRFLSRTRMLETFKSIGVDPKTLCDFCIGGTHPYFLVKDLKELQEK